MAILLDPQRPLAYGSPHATVQPYTFDLLPFSQHGSFWELFRHNRNFFPSNNVGFGPGREPNGRRARTPPSPSNPSGWQEGTKAQGCRPAWATWATGEPAPGTLGTLGPPRKGSHGGSGSHLLRFRRGLVTSSHPSEGGNKLLHLKTKRGAGGGWGGHCTQLMARTARLLRGKRCTLMCLERWSLRANFFSHTGHWYGFTPE